MLITRIKSLFQILLIGIGLGVVTGTLLKTIPPRNNVEKIGLGKFAPVISIQKKEKEITELSKAWERLSARQSDIEASGYLYLVDDNMYAELSPNLSMPAASTIKVPILLVALIMLDNKELEWDENLKLTKELKAGGAGWMGYQRTGKSFPIYEVATEMIRVSDNTATNLLIERIGGIEVLNKKLKIIGLSNTKLENLLPDLEGTNKTSSKDLSKTILLADKGNTLSRKSRDLFREIMSTSITNTLIPSGLLIGLRIPEGDSDYKLLIKGFRVYNKTGDIGISYSDSALIEMPDTRRAVAAFIVKGPFNDSRSPALIREMAAEMVPFLQ